MLPLLWGWPPLSGKSWISPRPLLPPANEVCEGYVFTGVCPQGRGVCRECLPPPPWDQRQTPPGRNPGAGTPPSRHPRQMVNKRAVGIPLKCILVYLCPVTGDAWKIFVDEFSSLQMILLISNYI